MNFRLVAKYLGHFSLAMAALMLPSAVWAAWFIEWRALAALLGAAAASAGFGLALAWTGRRADDALFQREALALVGLGWLLMAGLGALPYVFGGCLHPVDAYFEAMSGFTTTGSTVLTDIEAVSKGLLFWRSFTHWLGGMGIIVLFIAVLPYLGAGGKQLFRSETPGPDPRGLRPRIKDTALILYKIYIGFTVIETIALMLAGMSLYDALCHTFGTLATGGFSTKNASIAYFDSVAIDLIILFFMAAAGSNFALYFSMLRGDWKALFKDSEWRVYMIVLGAAILLITANLLGAQGVVDKDPAHGGVTPEYTPAHALRAAAFQTVSIMTTTGFCTEDFERWPYLSRALLVALMFAGACAGSTGGGIKIVRFMVLAKMAYGQLQSAFRPKTVQTVRIGGEVVHEDIQRTIANFFFLYLAIFTCATLYMSWLGLPLQTALTSVAATLNNIGPGLEHVGAVETYAFIPASGKILLSLCMAMGRLELFSICVLFLPSFWRRS